MAAKFTKHGDQVNSLTEMQAMWYEIECGHAHLRRRAYGKVGPPLLQSQLLLSPSVFAATAEAIRAVGRIQMASWHRCLERH